MESARTSHDIDLDNLKATELRLGLPGTADPPRPSKRSLTEANESNSKSSEIEDAAPVSKTQVVGWPPVRSFRRNSFQARKTEEEAAGLYVKVAMDGLPYLRKIDLKMYKGYQELREALEGMFKCFSLGDLLGNERRNGSEYTVSYEDRDGDWMLVGDVPWEMFIPSCKRLSIMRGSESRGLNFSA